ncbi:hypothetical protein niasHS_010795 [Heterodera schachtii]|uniref:Uncharacterized protein n=1 Tax=Heterodera schachtii TaxID=97005 RepID=A0ABD2ITR6_HETSC
MLRTDEKFFTPSSAVVTQIILPTIAFCVGMVVAMLIGINKCKQWELDKVIEIRRTRRIIQRLTARLRERNFKAIQKARDVRKRAIAAKEARGGPPPPEPSAVPPPFYRQSPPTGNSPPPTYEDSLLHQFFMECVSVNENGPTI